MLKSHKSTIIDTTCNMMKLLGILLVVLSFVLGSASNAYADAELGGLCPDCNSTCNGAGGWGACRIGWLRRWLG